MSYTNSALKSPVSDEIDRVMKTCEEGNLHYVEGLIFMYGHDSSASKFEPVFYLYDILKENCELSDKEILSLIDNSLSSVLDNSDH
jgi:hypothetical protein